MNFAISRDLLAQILAHAASETTEEVCGLLLGAGGTIANARAAANVAQDRTRRFELDPKILLEAHKSARAGEAAVIGHYHSHPSGEAMPSTCDAASAGEGELWLILAGNAYALFQATPGGPIHGAFRRCMLQIN